MAEYDDRTSIPTLIRGLLDDARDLIREELQLARAEIREEVSAAQSALIAFAVAAAVGLIGVMLLSVAIGSAIAYFLHWPAWAGYGSTAVLFFVASWGLVLYARARLKTIRAIPETKDSIKENIAWIQNKSGLR
jgi:fructose-specific phosphotransferase system IIC component